MISRRDLLVGAGASAAASLLAGCGARGEPGLLRLGFMTNLTHAPVLAGYASGRLARALAPVRIEGRAFRAGPRVVEALLGRSIDVGSTGPAAVVLTQARHGDGTFRVLSGVCSGGASLVALRGVRDAGDLRGKLVAVPQLGSTQDISLRVWLRENGAEDVRVTAMSSANILGEMRRGEIAAAWLPEPWATRAVHEVPADRVLDERERWPNGAFSTSLVAARRDFADERAADVARLVAAIADEIERARAEPAATRGEAHAAIRSLTGNAGPRALFDEAWERVDFTRDPLKEAIATFSRDARTLGIVPRVPNVFA